MWGRVRRGEGKWGWGGGLWERKVRGATADPSPSPRQACPQPHLQGYRAPSPRVWRIEGLTDRNEVVSLVPEDWGTEAGADGPGNSRCARGG